MKPHCSVRVVRKWCGIHTNLALRCFDILEGLNYGDLLVGIVLELAKNLRLGTAVPS
jgi:hypothetical protein